MCNDDLYRRGAHRRDRVHYSFLVSGADGTYHQAYPQLAVELAGDTTIRLIEQYSKGNLDLILQTDSVLGANVQNMPLCDFPMRCDGL